MFLRIAVVLALAACVPARKGSSRRGSLCGRVAEAELRRYVRELVAFGPRMGGTPSNDKSAAYLSAFFKKQGLEVAVLEDAPALAHWETSWKVALADGVGDRERVAVRLLRLDEGRPRQASCCWWTSSAKATPSEDWKGRVIYTPGDVGRAYAAIVKSGHLPAAILTSAPNDPKRYVDWSRLGSLLGERDSTRFRCSPCRTWTAARSRRRRRRSAASACRSTPRSRKAGARPSSRR